MFMSYYFIGMIFGGTSGMQCSLKGHNTQHGGHTGEKKELVIEIYSKSLVRAIGKVLHMKFS